MTKTTQNSTLSTIFANTGDMTKLREVVDSLETLVSSGDVSIAIKIGDEAIELSPERDEKIVAKIAMLLLKLKKDGFGQ